MSNCYGMEAGKLSTQLAIPLAEAKKLLDHYRLQFRRVTSFLQGLGHSAMHTLESRTLSGRRRLYPKPTWEKAKVSAKEKMKKWGHDPESAVQTKHINSALFGLSSSIERMGKNTPMQGSNADMSKQAMGCGFSPDGTPYLWHILEPVYGAKMVNMVHDEFVVEMRKEIAEPCFAAVGDAMTRAGAEFVKSIPMETEGRIATYWKK